MATVSAEIKKVIGTYWFHTDFFGETFTFKRRANRGATTVALGFNDGVTAIGYSDGVTALGYPGQVSRSIVGCIETERRAQLDAGDMTETYVDRAIISVPTDPFKGIDQIGIGDYVLLSKERDPVQQAFYFEGEIQEQFRHTWKLVFERETDLTRGIRE